MSLWEWHHPCFIYHQKGNKNMKTQMNALVMVLSLLTIAPMMSAHAGEDAGKHPRRKEVNKKIKKEEKEINRDEKSGKITPAQAQQDRQNLKNVKEQERADVRANGGHLTKDQQKGLNGELRDNQKQINQQKAGNSGVAPSAPAAAPASN